MSTNRLHKKLGNEPAAIERMVDQIAERFRPERIILFGSHARGQAHAGSDVDVLVVMPARNEVDQAIRIREAVDHPFPLDLIVRTPKNLERRLKLGDWFLNEIISEGRVLYEKADGGMGAKSRSRSGRRRKADSRKAAAK